jgi:hypothetical protein
MGLFRPVAGQLYFSSIPLFLSEPSFKNNFLTIIFSFTTQLLPQDVPDVLIAMLSVLYKIMKYVSLWTKQDSS